MPEKVIGLESVAIGTINSDGSMANTVTIIDHIIEGSAVIEIDEPTTSNFFVEDASEPDVSIDKPGAKRIKFSVSDIDNTDLILAFGGTASGASVWKSPTTKYASVEKSIAAKSEIYGTKQMLFEMARCKLKAGGVLPLSGDGPPGRIDFIANVLMPACSSSVPIKRTIET